jgi:lysophospholipase L1-like esterase
LRGRVTERLVFVAFGDSLTVGYQSPTPEDEWPRSTPYTRFLKDKTEKMLAHRAAVSLRVEFVNRGIVGELTEDMVNRFGRDVIEPRPDVVIILGGSNDLGWGLEPQSVASNLIEMYGESLSHGIEPVTCTVPSVLGFDEGIPPRLQLNGLIKKHSAELGIVCVDLFSATCDSTGRLRKEYSNDGLHLSPLGYEAMAEAMFSEAVSGVVSRHLGGTETPSKSSPQ